MCSRKCPIFARHPKCAPHLPGFAPRSRNSRNGNWSWLESLRPLLVKRRAAHGWPQNSKNLDWTRYHTDEVGNVFGTHAGYGHGFVTLSAHLDTVFPAGTPLNIRQQGSRLYGPGVSDNGAGVTAMLAIAAVLQAVGIRHALALLFIGNVGEEGEGDLRGMRHIFSYPRWKDSDSLQPGARWRRLRHDCGRGPGQPPF